MDDFSFQYAFMAGNYGLSNLDLDDFDFIFDRGLGRTSGAVSSN